MVVKVAVWNINHRTSQKAVSQRVGEAAIALEADVLVFTEYVDGEQQDEFKAELERAGYESIAVSPRGYRQNGVLMASRETLLDDDLLLVPGYTEAATINWVHRRIPEFGIDVVGMRAPSYKLRREQRGYWRQIQTILESARDRALLMLGDFNCDPESDRMPGSVVTNELRQAGYDFKAPDDGFSYCGSSGAKTRIDHSIATPMLRIVDSVYRSRYRRHDFVDPNGNGLSDHSVLEVRVAKAR